jgi:hypothetical protein
VGGVLNHEKKRTSLGKLVRDTKQVQFIGKSVPCINDWFSIKRILNPDLLDGVTIFTVIATCAGRN